jgi:hypothetical protein
MGKGEGKEGEREGEALIPFFAIVVGWSWGSLSWVWISRLRLEREIFCCCLRLK